MSDEAIASDDMVPAEGGGRSKKKLILFAAVPALLIAVGAGAMFTGAADPLLAAVGMGGGGEHAAPGEEVPSGPATYYELPQMLVNLNAGANAKKSNFLKIVVALELPHKDDTPKIDAAMPRVIDNFQVYLRELRIEDLRGSAGIYRLREELLLRVNAAVAPARITDVLFKEMLVQ
ncbi:MAG: flagellar basal body-associated FliL family protein [Alphaproteobacteria bacterium]